MKKFKLFIPLMVVVTYLSVCNLLAHEKVKNLSVEVQIDDFKIYTGIITHKLEESKAFYMKNFGFKVKFENDWFVLLHTGGETDFQLAFMLPDQPTQAPVFQKVYKGQGMWITVEVDDVDQAYEEIKSMYLPIETELRDEPWGERHFTIIDPNGIGVDVVSYIGNNNE